MPEGDTIHRTAASLREAIGGRVMTSFAAPLLVVPRPMVGETIESVDSHGKHLVIIWSGGVALRTHMRMTGSWHLYRPGERWRMPQHQMRVAIGTDAWEAVCFRAPDVETYHHRPGAPPEPLARLGPDLIVPDADLAECVHRLLSYPARDEPIADVLLDQAVACGVGNVFKSEVLFACRVDPFTAVESIDPATAERLVDIAHQMLLANRSQPGRVTTTVGDARLAVISPLAVYGRAGRPCLVCGSTIAMRHHGRHARSTYWCPACQAQPGVPAPLDRSH